MLLGSVQYNVLNYMTQLAPLGQPVKASISDIRSATKSSASEVSAAVDALLDKHAIKRISAGQYVVQEDIANVVKRRNSGDPTMLTPAAKALLDTLIRLYPIGREVRVPFRRLQDEAGLRNPNNIKHRMKTLDEMGAIELISYHDLVYTLKIKQGVEAFTSTPAPRTKKDVESSAQIKALNERIAQLEETIRQMTMAKHICWLWKVKGADKWKDTTFDPPTKEDMKELEFYPLHDIAPLLNVAQLEVYTHLKSQGDYHKLGEFIWEATSEHSTLYRSIQTGQQFGRVSEIFNDGRFQKKETQ